MQKRVNGTEGGRIETELAWVEGNVHRGFLRLIKKPHNTESKDFLSLPSISDFKKGLRRLNIGLTE